MRPDPTTHEAAIVVALRRIIRAVDLHSRKLKDTCGLTGPQLACLLEVDRAGTLSPAAVADRVHLARATVTGIVARLEARGLLARERSTKDRRSVELRVTDLGAQVLALAPSPLDRRFVAELARVPRDEHHALLGALDRIASMMHVGGDHAAPLLDALGEDPSSGHRPHALTTTPQPRTERRTDWDARALVTKPDAHASRPDPTEDRPLEDRSLDA